MTPAQREIADFGEMTEMTEWYLISFLIFKFLNVSIFPTLHGIRRNRRSHRNNRITIILLSHPLGAGKNKLEVKCRYCGSILANVLTNDYKDLFGLFPKGELLKELYRGVPLVECLSFPRLFDFKIYHPCKTHDKKTFIVRWWWWGILTFPFLFSMLGIFLLFLNVFSYHGERFFFFQK